MHDAVKTFKEVGNCSLVLKRLDKWYSKTVTETDMPNYKMTYLYQILLKDIVCFYLIALCMIF